jgi:hypothetical protein
MICETLHALYHKKCVFIIHNKKTTYATYPIHAASSVNDKGKVINWQQMLKKGYQQISYSRAEKGEGESEDPHLTEGDGEGNGNEEECDGWGRSKQYGTGASRLFLCVGRALASVAVRWQAWRWSSPFSQMDTVRSHSRHLHVLGEPEGRSEYAE